MIISSEHVSRQNRKRGYHMRICVLTVFPESGCWAPLSGYIEQHMRLRETVLTVEMPKPSVTAALCHFQTSSMCAAQNGAMFFLPISEPEMLLTGQKLVWTSIYDHMWQHFTILIPIQQVISLSLNKQSKFRFVDSGRMRHFLNSKKSVLESFVHMYKKKRMPWGM